MNLNREARSRGSCRGRAGPRAARRTSGRLRESSHRHLPAPSCVTIRSSKLRVLFSVNVRYTPARPCSIACSSNCRDSEVPSPSPRRTRSLILSASGKRKIRGRGVFKSASKNCTTSVGLSFSEHAEGMRQGIKNQGCPRNGSYASGSSWLKAVDIFVVYSPTLLGSSRYERPIHRVYMFLSRPDRTSPRSRLIATRLDGGLRQTSLLSSCHFGVLQSRLSFRDLSDRLRRVEILPIGAFP